jgi:UDP:flavonoid glycosyltransferase YjiC (YdhE family)
VFGWLEPRFVDGPANAARVAALGAGFVTEDVAAGVRGVLTDHRYRAAAERLTGEIRALPPVGAAIDVLSRSAGSSGRSVRA